MRWWTRKLAERAVPYFAAIDTGLETLSRKIEGRLRHVPSWVLTRRLIRIGIRPNLQVLLRASPIQSRGPDVVQAGPLLTTADEAAFKAPLPRGVKLELTGAPGLVWFSDLTFTPVGQPHDASIVVPALWGMGDAPTMFEHITVSAGSEEAVSLWNAAQLREPPRGSYVDHVRQTMNVFERMLDRPAFHERRIHRYLHEHAEILLPPYKRLFFEHSLYLGNEERVADFILEREDATPGWLVEIESPAVPVFRRDRALTQQARHACDQIADWVRIIERDGARNASGAMSFLAGGQQRLVIIGRGLDRREEMLNSRFSGTTVWTYDLLLEQARARWNRDISLHRRLVGLPEKRFF